MPSVDVVSKVDLQALDNATNNAKREIATRFDFRNTKSDISFDRKTKKLQIATSDDRKVKAIMDMLVSQCVRLKLDPKVLSLGPIEAASGSNVRASVEVKEGISRDIAQKIVQMVKASKLKVQPAIQDDQVRLTGKNIDDLQEIMRQLRESNYGIPFQFINMKS